MTSIVDYIEQRAAKCKRDPNEIPAKPRRPIHEIEAALRTLEVQVSDKEQSKSFYCTTLEYRLDARDLFELRAELREAKRYEQYEAYLDAKHEQIAETAREVSDEQ